MTGLQAFMRILRVTSLISLIGVAFLWHRTVLYQAISEAELRGERLAAATLRKQKKDEIALLRAHAAEDRARARQVRAVRKDLADVQSIDDGCRISGDALQLLDAIGNDPSSAP